MRMKHKRYTNGQTELTLPVILKRCLLFIPVFCIMALICTAVISLIFYNTDDPTSKINACSIISLYLSTSVTSFILAKKMNGGRVIGGVILGIYIFVLTYLASLLIDGGDSGVTSLLLRCGIIAVSTVSALLAGKGVKKGAKRKRHG